MTMAHTQDETIEPISSAEIVEIADSAVDETRVIFVHFLFVLRSSVVAETFPSNVRRDPLFFHFHYIFLVPTINSVHITQTHSPRKIRRHFTRKSYKRRTS